MVEPTAAPTFSNALRFWLKLGFISFGGPTGQIAIMHTELVERRRWISESRFLHALNYCMLLPGPEAQQLAIYVGWLLHGTWGGIVAGSLFVLPSAIILWILSYVYVVHGTVPIIAAILYGLKPAVIGIVAHAVLRIGSRALKNPVMWAIAGLSFAAIYFFKVPFPVIIAAAAAIGLIGSSISPATFIVSSGHGKNGSIDASVLDDRTGAASHHQGSWGRALRVVALCTVLWWTPIVASGLTLGWGHTLTQQGFFFSKAAMVTFGGAYAVLPYVAQQAVEQHHWLSAGQMLDGLGLAETTPGPLIMVLQFVGFLGGWNHAGGAPPLMTATLGAMMTTWVTFVPCFLWIFLGAPFIERLRNSARLSAVLSCITSAVVGVVLNLAVWFTWSVIRKPDANLDGLAAAAALAAFAVLASKRLGVMPVVALGAIFGLGRHFLLL